MITFWFILPYVCHFRASSIGSLRYFNSAFVETNANNLNLNNQFKNIVWKSIFRTGTLVLALSSPAIICSYTQRPHKSGMLEVMWWCKTLLYLYSQRIRNFGSIISSALRKGGPLDSLIHLEKNYVDSFYSAQGHSA